MQDTDVASGSRAPNLRQPNELAVRTLIAAFQVVRDARCYRDLDLLLNATGASHHRRARIPSAAAESLFALQAR